MAVVSIPLNAVAYQSLSVPLSGHVIRFEVQQRSTGLFAAFWCDGVACLSGVLCQNRSWLARKACYGLPGDFAFVDTEGTADPDYTGLGGRFVLVYEEGRNA